ncbi:glycosyltransferase 87 family protein [Luteibaculum oceani]|uniref:DUF2029 domain-containing protein n=1 Tax=Luteibaculum oceani TaxID=1294296 RepID=A0A5C6VBV8_9FLAO|nr:glycosyltransferase 87 family protein [Luteibaculum oceani]TXC81946.1 DUF2029 domain-containing protein [Luteibaculum oceani]
MLAKKYTRIAFGLLYLLLAVYFIKEAMGNGDFKVFLEAAKMLRNGENPYNKWIFVSEGNYCLYYYSPLWATLLIPFSYLPNFVPNLLWLTLNFLLLLRCFRLMGNYLNLQELSQKKVFWIQFLCVVMTVRFLLYNFGMIQMTVFLLWGILEGLDLIRKGRFGLGGLLIAFVINVKILPIVILPYLLYRAYYKGFLSSLFFLMVLLLLPSIYLGWSVNYILLQDWWMVINPSNPEHTIETDLGVHSLTALIPNLLTETDGKLDLKRNLFNLDEYWALSISNAIRFSLVAFTIYFLSSLPFKKAKNAFYDFRAIAYIILLIPLIFPHQLKYAFTLILPACFYLLHFVFSQYANRNQAIGKFRWVAILVFMGIGFVLMTLTTDGVIGRELSNITQHYKTITWGALFLIGALILVKPNLQISEDNE